MQSDSVEDFPLLRPHRICLGSFGRSGEGATMKDVVIWNSGVVLRGISYVNRDDGTVLCSWTKCRRNFIGDESSTLCAPDHITPGIFRGGSVRATFTWLRSVTSCCSLVVFAGVIANNGTCLKGVISAFNT